MNIEPKLSTNKSKLHQTVVSMGFDNQLEQVMLQGLDNLSEEVAQESLERLERANQQMPNLLRQAFELGLLSPTQELFDTLRRSVTDAEALLALLFEGKNDSEQNELINAFSEHAITEPEPIQRRFVELIRKQLHSNTDIIELDKRESLIIWCLQQLQKHQQQPIAWFGLRTILPLFRMDNEVLFPLEKTGKLQVKGADAIYKRMLDKHLFIDRDELRVSHWFVLLENLNLIKTEADIIIEKKAEEQMQGFIKDIQRAMINIRSNQENIASNTQGEYQPRWPDKLKFSLSCVAVINKIIESGNLTQPTDTEYSSVVFIVYRPTP